MKNKLLYWGQPLDIDKCQCTYNIWKTRKGLKIEQYSMDSGIKDYIFFLEENKLYNKETEWHIVGEDGRSNVQRLYDNIIDQEFRDEYYGIVVYRKIKK